MYGVMIDTKKAHEVPASLLTWTERAHKGPRALVAGLCEGSEEPMLTLGACYSLKAWTQELGPHALVAQLAC